VPLHFTNLRKEDIQPIIDKIIKHIAGWKGRLLSCAGRLILLKACLASVPIYLMSIIKFLKWAITVINSQMSHFLWNNNEDCYKYHLDNWQLVAQKKEVGGFGIPDMRSLNMPLLSSWIFRYGLQSESIWVKIVDHKYNNNSPNIICSDRTAISPFWKGVMWALQAARMGFKWLVGNGRKVRFWEDHWFDNSSLAIQFWPLYVINDQQGKTINQVWDGQVLILSFRRAVSENLMNMWFDLLSILESVRLQDGNDQIIRCFNSNGKYPV
jgi:hypothetical protein